MNTEIEVLQKLAAHSVNMLATALKGIDPMPPAMVNYFSEPDELTNYWQSEYGYTPFVVNLGGKVYILNAEDIKEPEVKNSLIL